jgi:hypothetical protein
MPSDRWSEYKILSGHEDPESCFWCGVSVKAHRRYCCEEHRDLYYRHFYWPMASFWCLGRLKKCADCGGHAHIAHHIEPLNGQYRLWNVRNRPENLVALCSSCHRKRHTSLETILEQMDIFEAAKIRRQLVFDGFTMAFPSSVAGL